MKHQQRALKIRSFDGFLNIDIVTHLLRSIQIFSEIAENAETRDTLLEGIDEFIDDLTVLPPSIWDPETRLPPPDKVPTGHGPSSKVSF